jgi:putative ABC transport system permease protein
MKIDASNPNPPRWATMLLNWFCAPHLREEVIGDLQEEFRYQVTRVGPAKAKLDYIRNVVGFIKPFAIKRKTKSPSILTMNIIRHYFIVAVRNLVRHRAFASINIVGLALGMTCCLFIFLWVRDERRIDNFHEHGDNLYSLYYSTSPGENIEAGYSIPVGIGNPSYQSKVVLAEQLKEAVPEIELASPYTTSYELPWGYAMTFQVGEEKHKLEGSSATNDFFKMFSYPIIAGDINTALRDVNSLAVSRKMAAMFFETPQSAIGKIIRYENRIDFMITAVFEDVPAESSMKFDYLMSYENSKLNEIEHSDNKWPTIIKLRDDANIADVEKKINRIVEELHTKAVADDINLKLGLQPFRDHYLISNFVNGVPSGGRIEYLRVFSGVAVFILIIACINFMNLATARSIKRAREVGIRKVAGSSRGHLIAQFFGESLLMSFLALLLSVVLVYSLLSLFNDFTGKTITVPITDYTSWVFLLGLTLVTGLIAGSYPALYLSSLRPARTLKGIVRFTSASIWFRRGLTGIQFALSIVLIIATIVVSRQTSYVQEANLGYDRENLIYLRIEGDLNKKYDVFKEKALSMAGIDMVDRSSEAPHAMNFVIASDIHWEGQQQNDLVGFKPLSVGYDFIKVMDMKIVDGRDFSVLQPTDSADAFMVNEEAVRQMGIKDPIGKWVSAWAKKGHIIAVLKDYHTHSLHEPIKPVIMDVKEYEYFGVVIVRTKPGKTTEALASLEKIHNEINPNYPFSYQFADQEYKKLYKNEQVMAKLSNAFAILAILISCLGLLGLVMFAAEQRTKEFGIRKVLGATVTHIVTLLSKDFLILITAAFVIAAPVGGMIMKQWLNSFAFPIGLDWGIFAIAGCSALFVAFITISVQAMTSATSNPVKSLKVE